MTETMTESTAEQVTLPESRFAEVVAKLQADYSEVKRRRADYVAATDVDSAVQDIVDAEPEDTEYGRMIVNLEKARKAIALLEPKINEWARAEALKRNNADFDEQKERADYNEQQKALKDQLSSMMTIMATMGEFDDENEPTTEGARILQELDNSVPSRINKPGGGGSSASVDSESAAIREWAKRNGMEVGEKGRIKAEIKDAYYKATKANAETPAE